jgi:ubiquinol-cytochrome c reductase iron-sulfur subunit
VTALGPSVGESIVATPWRRGRRLVDEQGVPLTADDVPESSFVTAFPEGADRRELGSPVVLVREDPSTLRLPAGREDWAPEGILGFSKICTHAGCAIALYRQPLHEPTSLPPGLGCPCHYSVFDTRRGGSVVAGPAGRALPQLPLVIGPGRELRAGGGFSGPIGPSWWGVRKT